MSKILLQFHPEIHESEKSLNCIYEKMFDRKLLGNNQNLV